MQRRALTIREKAFGREHQVISSSCLGLGNIYRFFFSSTRRHTSLQGDWSSDVCSSDLSTASITTPWRPFLLPFSRVFACGSNMLIMLRHVATLAPAPVLMTGSLAVSAPTAVVLSMFHPLDATVMIVLWNFGVAAVL